MALEQKQFNIPSEITFHMWEKDITITRKDGYCDISNLRKTCSLKDLTDFKKYQKEFLHEIQKEIGDEPIKNDGHITLVHEKILERILRWYEVNETEVIDKFVQPGLRTVGQYKYNKVEILVHLESKYINGSKFCPLFGKQIWRWLDLRGTKELFKHYAEHNKIDSKAIVKKGLEYAGTDIWIPQNLLPMLAIWCSPEYAIFVSDVMNMFHNDPLKLAALAIKESDRQTGKHTVALLNTVDTKEEHDQLIAQLEKKVKRLSDRVFTVEYEKSIIEKDKNSIEAQFEPVRALINDYPNTSVDQLALSRKMMLDKHVAPLEKELVEKEEIIRDLEEKLSNERKDKEKAYQELYIIQESHDEEVRDKDEYIEHLENRYVTNSKKKTTRKKEASQSTAIKDNNLDNQIKSSIRIMSAVTPGSCSQVTIYTKRDYDGKFIFAMVPGKSDNYRSLKYTPRGSIILDRKNTAEQYIETFAKNNRNAYVNHIGLDFILTRSHTPRSFEQLFTEEHKGDIISKTDSYGYKVKDIESLC